jgi:Asp-tRNA(Asn)/Glu-tRNA(Gln) amidotransferase A subunit family amidase
MDSAELWRLSATEAAGLIRAGTIESGELVSACLERVARVRPDVQAWTLLESDHGRSHARGAE